MILVNGSKGVGTGFSTDILSYNPIEIIQYIKESLENPDLKKTGDVFIPYYEGFTGTITKITDSKFIIKGKYEKVGIDKIRITELPIGLWTNSFKEHLEELIETQTDKSGKKTPSLIKDYNDMSSDTTIDFTIILQKGKLEELEAIQLENGCNGLEKLFKLFTTQTTTNMHAFDAEDKLKKYLRVDEMIDEFSITRLKMYQTRKDYLINAIEKEIVLLSNKAKFVKENLDETIDLRRKKKQDVIVMLKEKGYDIIEGDEEYKYLIKMPMDSVTEEVFEKLMKEYGNKNMELETIKLQSPQEMWIKELDILKIEYLKYKEHRSKGSITKAKSIVIKKIVKKVVKTTSAKAGV